MDHFPELNEKKINKINFKKFIWFIGKRKKKVIYFFVVSSK